MMQHDTDLVRHARNYEISVLCMFELRRGVPEPGPQFFPQASSVAWDGSHSTQTTRPAFHNINRHPFQEFALRHLKQISLN